MDELYVPRETYEEIKRVIENEESPVGIDAQKAHILILHKLIDLEERIEHLEQRVEE